MKKLIIRITQENKDLLKDEKIGCFIVPENLSENFMSDFVTAAKEANKLVLIEGENAPETYQKYNADGFIVSTVKEEKPQKILKQLKARNPQAVMGVITRNRRHEAMLVSECEPDFVIFRFWKDGFNENAELLKWYNDLFLIQNAALIEEDCDYKSLPADFIILPDTRYL